MTEKDLVGYWVGMFEPADDKEKKIIYAGDRMLWNYANKINLAIDSINGDPVAQVTFILLTLLWVFFTYNAYHTICNKQVAAHRNWMEHSYAFTLSAITLLLWKWIIVTTLETRPMDTYRVVAWRGRMADLSIPCKA